MVYSAIIIILLVGGALIFRQPQGVGLSPDSLVYLESAENIRAGRGPVVRTGRDLYLPVKRFPPLYPYLLAPLSYESLPLLNGALFVITLTAYLLVLRRHGSPLILLLATTSLATHPAIIELHLHVWSETLLLALITLSILLVSRATTGKSIFFFGIGLLSAAQLLTRYAGAASMAAALLWGASFPSGWRQKLFLLLGLSLSPLGILFFDLREPRVFSYHPPSVAVLSGMVVPVEWVFPIFDRTFLHLIGVVIIAGALWVVRRHHLGGYLSLYIIGYLSLLAVSLALFDAELSLYSRILAPLLPLLGVITALLIMKGEGIVRLTLAFSIFGSQIISHIPSSLSYFIDAEDGLGYRSSRWRHSPLIAALKDEHIPLASNGAEVLSFYLGRYTVPLPEKYSALSLLQNEVFNQEMQELVNQGMWIACFSTISWRWYLPSCEELQEDWSYRPALTFPDGILLRPK